MEPRDNHWYVIASSHELRKKPVGKQRFGERYVLWRDASGNAAGLRDKCPHRGASLALGQIKNGCVECPYHGFVFAPDGECLATPQEGDKRIPASLRARSLTLRERYDFVWLWRGDDIAVEQLPEVPFAKELEDRDHGELVTRWNAHYSRVLEAQIDYAHLPYVHRTTIGARMDPAVVVQCDPDDHGLHARTGEEARGGDHQYLNFRYPNLWVNHTFSKVVIAVAFAPVDMHTTEAYVRFYHSFTRIPILRQLISWIGAKSSWLIVRQDLPVVQSHEEQNVDDATGEQLLSADVNVAHYRKLRRRYLLPADGSHTDAEGGEATSDL